MTPLPVPMALDGETQAAILPRAVQAGMRWRPNTALAFIGDHEVTLVDVLSRELETLTDVDTVVIRTHGLPDDELYTALDGQVAELDASATRSPSGTWTAPSTTATSRPGHSERESRDAAV